MLESGDHGLDALGNSGGLGIIARMVAEVVGAPHEDDDFGVYAIEFAVIETPEDVLQRIASPAEVGGVPAVKGVFPVDEEFRVVRRSPAPGDGVTHKVKINAALGALGEELLVGGEGIGIGARAGLVGRSRSPAARAASEPCREQRHGEFFLLGVGEDGAEGFPQSALELGEPGLGGGEPLLRRGGFLEERGELAALRFCQGDSRFDLRQAGNGRRGGGGASAKLGADRQGPGKQSPQGQETYLAESHDRQVVGARRRVI